METTWRYKLFGIGKLPADLRKELDAEGAMHVYEGVPVHYAFDGHVPGFSVSGGKNTRTYSGAIALSARRVVGTLSVVPFLAGKAMDVEWASEGDGPGKVTIDAGGVAIDVDVAEVDPQFGGHLTLHFAVGFTEEELADFPKRALAIPIPREWVLKLVGVPV